MKYLVCSRLKNKQTNKKPNENQKKKQKTKSRKHEVIKYMAVTI